MTTERAETLQTVFLNYVCQHKVPVTVFLVNGVKLQGTVTRFDNFCLFLERGSGSQIVYKQAIATIMPGGPMQLGGAEEGLSKSKI